MILLGEVAFIAALGPKLLAARQAAHLPPPKPRLLLGLTETLLGGSLIAWLYVSTRPRFGPGIATAVMVGVVAWLFIGVVNAIHMISDSFVFPPSLVVSVGAAMLPIFLFASIVGAWADQE